MVDFFSTPNGMVTMTARLVNTVDVLTVTRTAAQLDVSTAVIGLDNLMCPPLAMKSL